MSIRVLPDELVNQIAAGEVIERPASVVKELVENALDAGAMRVDVELERGGCGLIRVRDDGAGIGPEEIGIALARHATSKIASLDDLENIATLGFRGEALPSIASVSRLSLVSRTAATEHAWGLEARDGAMGAPAPAAHPRGTSVEVRDLFFNVPARRKFLRTEATEFQHIARHARAPRPVAVRSRILAVAQRPQRLDAAAGAVVGRGIGARRQDLRRGFRGARRSKSGTTWNRCTCAAGWRCRPSRAASPICNSAFLNGRFVRDKLLAGAARRAYQDVLFNGRFPAYVLYLDLDPAMVDVNAHPQKLEVRFRDSRRVHDFLFRTVERALAETRPDRAIRGQRAARLAFGQRGLRRCPGAFRRRDSCCRKRGSRPGADAYRGYLGGAGRGGSAAVRRRGRPRARCGRRLAGGGARRRGGPAGLRHRAAAWRLHPGRVGRRLGAGGHACRA